jgi:hypothetical protein
MNPLADILENWVGRGRAISVEQLAREADAGERTTNRWIEDESMPHLRHVQNMIASTVLPAEFRKALADYVLRNAIDIAAVVRDAATPAESPLRLSIDVDERLARLQRVLADVTCPTSAGGSLIDASERSRIDPEMAEIDVLVCRLKRKIQALGVKRAG